MTAPRGVPKGPNVPAVEDVEARLEEKMHHEGHEKFTKEKQKLTTESTKENSGLRISNCEFFELRALRDLRGAS